MLGQEDMLLNRPKPIHRLVGNRLVGADRDQPSEGRGSVNSIDDHHSQRKPSYFT